MQALAERLTDAIGDRVFVAYQPLAFHALKTAVPAPDASLGSHVAKVGRRAKYLVFELDAGVRMLVHLSQAGRLDIEEPPKRTKPKGSAVRLEFGPSRDEPADLALLLREHGTERKAGWWLLAPGDEGPLARLGPEPDSKEFEAFVMTADDGRRIHTILRDQRTVA